MFRMEEIFSLPLQVQPGQSLTIVVENQGRICFGADLADRKGILGNVSLGGKVLTGWKMTGLPLDDGPAVSRYSSKMLETVNTELKLKTHLR